MRRNVRIVALLICLTMLVTSFASCDISINDRPSGPSGVTSEPLESSSAHDPDDENYYVYEIIYPSVSASSLKVDLTEKKLEEFRIKLALVKRLFNEGEKGTENKFKNELYKLLTLEAAMETQCDTAYLLYYYDTQSSNAWSDYAFAYDLYDEANDLLWDFYNEYREKSGSFADVLNDVFDKEFTSTVPVSEYSNYYADEMNALEGEYNSLVNSGSRDEKKIFGVLKDYLVAAKGFAVAGKAENYYEYASKYTYGRTDTAEQRERFREYTKEILVPLYKELDQKSLEFNDSLSFFEYNRTNRYLQEKYDSFGEDYLFEYFDSLPESSGKAMREAFEKDRILVGDKKGSYNTAMVLPLGNTPICYFDKDDMTLETMSHELGHYYAHVAPGNAYYASHFSYALQETHSGTNTLLLFSFLSDKLDGKAIRAAELFIVCNSLYTTVMGVIRDEFDEIVFTSDPSTLTIEELKSIMSGLIEEYGIGDMSGNATDNLMSYWKRLIILYSMRNYCYSAANIAALQIYTKSKDDYAAACEIYKKIVEEPENRGSFNATIVKAGLTTPYAEKTYIELQKLADVE